MLRFPNSGLAASLSAPLATWGRWLLCGAALLNIAAIGSCHKKYDAFALTSTGQIIQFQTNKPDKILNKATVGTSTSGDSLVQIAYRPRNDTLYCVTSHNEVCTVEPTTGVVSVIGGPFIDHTLSNVAASFDPVSDQLRVTATDPSTSSGRFNVRIDPTSGAIASATSGDNGDHLDYDSSSINGAPQLNAIAYANPVNGASDTTLYALDVNTQSLVRVGDRDNSNPVSVDEGKVHVIGSLSAGFTNNVGFSIAPQDGTAFAVLGGAAQLYTIDLGNGAATLVGAVHNADYTLISLAVAPNR